MKTVVVVDDSYIMRRIMESALIGLGYNVIGEADNGHDALEVYAELKPDIITLDIVMDGISGIDTLKQIIEIDAEANVIMISSMSQKPIVQDAIEAGAKGFLVKPFDEYQIKRTFEKLFDG